MRNLSAVQAVAFCVGFYAGTALAADTGLGIDTQIVGQRIVAQVNTSNPPAVTLQASGAVLNASLNLQSQSGQCLTLTNQIAPGICVPVGPGAPVSPN